VEPADLAVGLGLLEPLERRCGLLEGRQGRDVDALGQQQQPDGGRASREGADLPGELGVEEVVDAGQLPARDVEV